MLGWIGWIGKGSREYPSRSASESLEIPQEPKLILWQAKLDEGTSAPESPAQTPKEK